jgi:hypothetical protein
MSDTRLLQEKWAPVLNHGGLPEIKDAYRKQVVATLLENQERAIREEHGMLNEVAVNSWSCWFRSYPNQPNPPFNA